MKGLAISLGCAALLGCGQARALPASVWQQGWGMKRPGAMTPLVLAFAVAMLLPAPVRAYWGGEQGRQCAGVDRVASERAIKACTSILSETYVRREAKPELLDYRGDAYMRAGRFAEALADFDGALSIDPNDSDAYGGRCRVNAVWKRALSTSLADCDTAVRLRPSNPDARDSRALLYVLRGDYARARADIDAALSGSARRAGSLYLRGLVKSKTGDASAQADLDAAKALDPKVAEFYASVGLTP
ncbi:MAG: tetratricopeptide repeat protein [Alphaproteobacteria bacterium]|nr:tetratricopeptide repeat protein [Alphaproteobacteria bacterium]